MRKREYNKRLSEVLQDAKGLQILKAVYALQNNQVNQGDIVIDSYQMIKVNRIKVSCLMEDDYPECIYYGYIVNKSGEIASPIRYSHTWQRFVNTIIKNA